MDSPFVDKPDQGKAPSSDNEESFAKKLNSIEIPSLALPKGGGALKGIDEKFEVNPSNGTAGYSIPLPISPGRNGFTPALALSYNSGSGNSAFGLGWDIGLPTIQRKTDKKLPRYRDEFEEDVFMFSGVEDLVPFLKENNGSWQASTTGDTDYSVKRYRPRIEGGLSKIERITNKDLAVYWKVTTKENVVTVFGRTKECRIADPEDDTRIFKWLPEFSFDNKGNWITYEYKADNNLLPAERDLIPNELHEQNRKNGNALYSNQYLKRVSYGNRTPYFADPTTPFNPQNPIDPEYFFELVFDYGDHNPANPSHVDTAGFSLDSYRPDAFSNFHAGFEIRTARLCNRVLMFHHFKDEHSIGLNYLVRSLDLVYGPSSINKSSIAEVTYLNTITQSGYIRKQDRTYSKKSLPPTEFQYQQLLWNKDIKEVNTESIVNAPVGLTNNYQWVDFYGEGVSGIFTEQGDGWYYKSNLGVDGNGELKLTPAKIIAPKPSFTGFNNGTLQLLDLDGNGKKQVVINTTELKGFFELTDENDWEPFRSFIQSANIDLRDPYVRTIDLNGDGMPELVVTEENVFVWYASEGKRGYAAAESVSKAFDEEKGPAIVFADILQTIFLADMSGDGMTDIVRIRNAEVCYWPNMGYGKFGAKVNMGNAPVFDTPDQFNPEYLHLADVSGTGATDIIYTRKNKCTAWLNLSGNKWENGYEIETLPLVHSKNQLAVIDLLGTGTSCIVWSSDLPSDAQSPLRYIDLMSSKKPHVMLKHVNNMGKETTVEYKSSAWFYLKDKKQGNTWITKLPFPVQCVSQVTINDVAAGTFFTNSYSYHHGYYDHSEREFRGFGRVEQTDTEEFENFKLKAAGNIVEDKLHQPPVKTITWFHTGAYFNGQKILNQFEAEYKKGPFEFDLPKPVLPNTLTPDESREALRACKGMILRQEVYAIDNSLYEDNPYSVNTHNCLIRLLQPRLQNRHAVFLMHESETLDIHYERNLNDPRIAHTLNLEIDNVGNVLKSAAVVFGRKTTDASLPAEIQQEQSAVHVILTQDDFTVNPLNPASDYYFDQPTVYRAKLLSETKTYELTNTTYNKVSQLSIADLTNDYANAATINYESAADGSLQKRLIEDVRTLYLNNDLINPMPLGQMDTLSFIYQTYHLAFAPSLVSSLFGTRVTPAMLTDTKYVQADGTNWWIQSGRNNYLNAGEAATDVQKRFYLPVSVKDPYDIETQLFYDNYNLLLVKTEDALQNTVTTAIDYRVLQPVKMTDINNNSSEILTDELGMVIAASVYGDESDGIHGDKPISDYTTIAPANLDEVISNPQKFLQQATSFFYYDLFAWMNNNQPVCFASVVRETHVSELTAGSQTKVFLNIGYSSGLGQNLQIKVQAEPGDASQWNNGTLQTIPNVNPRWIGTGRTVLNNKGNPVKQYEPFFSTTYKFESEDALVQIGFASTTCYDPLSRPIRVDHPNGTFSSTEFDAWMQKTFDENDNVKNSNWFLTITNPDPAQPYYQLWYDKIKNDPEKVDAVKDAAKKAAAHDHTPAIAHLDSLGRTIYTIADNGAAGKYATRFVLDIENNQRQVIDARDNKVMQYDYDMVSQQAHQTSMDAGERWMLNDVMNKPIYKWDSRDQRIWMEYDDLYRPTNQWLTQNVSLPKQSEKLVGVTVYGENQTLNGNTDTQLNLRGKPFQLYDQSGLAQTLAYDFKGNVKTTCKQLTSDYKNIANWNRADKNSLLDKSAENTFIAASKFDATNKAVELDMPDGSKIYPFYNLTNLLKQIDVFVGSKRTTVSFVQSIDYNAKGQRQSILYGNNTTTGYTYEKTTYRLSRLLTTRNTGADIMQDLNYTYDPVGNITQIIDHARQTVFFNNAAVDPSSQYTYDAIYRLIDATGREHAGQNKASDQFDTDKTQDASGNRLVVPGVGDKNAMQRYEQQYEYDSVGNMLQMIHNAGNGVFTNRWTRTFEYNNDDTARANNKVAGGTQENNQLLNEYTGARGPASNPKYSFDAHGNMLNLQKGSYNLTWNYADQLQQVDLGGGGIAYYVYDAGGQRVRKVIENGGLVKERIYLSSYEVYRETQGGILQLERETLHIMDDKSRIAMVETVTQGSGRGLPFLIRYQYANHLGSSCFELAGMVNSADKTFVAPVISYEEYYPYGSTSYQAMDNQIETNKRYRYTSMERDDESGLEYHNARYYINWLNRWLNPDPLFFDIDNRSRIKSENQDSLGTSKPKSSSTSERFRIDNLYAYCVDNPVTYSDIDGFEESKPEEEKGLSIENAIKILTTATEAPFEAAEKIAHFSGMHHYTNILKGWTLGVGVLGVAVETGVAYHFGGAGAAAQEVGISGGSLALNIGIGTAIAGPLGAAAGLVIGIGVKFGAKPVADYLEDVADQPPSESRKKNLFEKNYAKSISSQKQRDLNQRVLEKTKAFNDIAKGNAIINQIDKTFAERQAPLLELKIKSLLIQELSVDEVAKQYADFRQEIKNDFLNYSPDFKTLQESTEALIKRSGDILRRKD